MKCFKLTPNLVDGKHWAAVPCNEPGAATAVAEAVRLWLETSPEVKGSCRVEVVHLTKAEYKALKELKK